MSICAHNLHNIETLVGQNNNKKMGQEWMTRAKEMFPFAILGTRDIGSSALT
jgi:hypothetical protein